MYLVGINIPHHRNFSFPAQVTKETEFFMFYLQLFILEAESSVQGRVCVRGRLSGLGGKGQGPRSNAAAPGVEQGTLGLAPWYHKGPREGDHFAASSFCNQDTQKMGTLLSAEVEWAEPGLTGQVGSLLLALQPTSSSQPRKPHKPHTVYTLSSRA